LSQERVDAPVVEMPPTPFAAGVIARRDLARGPHVSPANESLRGVVGLTRQLDDATFATIYSPPFAVNPLRAFGGYGIQIWGARTLSEDLFLRYVAVRRCLSAIERKVFKALGPIVFEPHNQLLWLRVTQLVFGILLPVFESGALRGSRPDEAFFVRCDATNNPPEAIAEGRLLCEVGVAIAAPAEFIVFRVGRREGVIEVLE
jgi:phage tail sheath protein FI